MTNFSPGRSGQEPRFSIVIPVYRNEASLSELLATLVDLAGSLPGACQLVFVVDGSPDNSLLALRAALPTVPLPTVLVSHSRNFGSFAAIRTGLQHCQGEYIAVTAADLQEPPSLVSEMLTRLAADEADIALGTRRSRSDGFMSDLASRGFWALYRRFIVRDMPPGGIDVFACNRQVRDAIASLEESHTSLIGLLFWVGFRRCVVPYDRQPRLHGKGSWNLSRKIRYLGDSVFAFSALPIRLLWILGILGLATSIVVGLIVFVAYLAGAIAVPGYTALVLIITFFSGLNSLGLGIVGSYVWRAADNSRGRPQAVVAATLSFNGTGKGADGI